MAAVRSYEREELGIFCIGPAAFFRALLLNVLHISGLTLLAALHVCGLGLALCHFFPQVKLAGSCFASRDFFNFPQT